MVYNVIQQTFPDGSHRWKYFTYGMRVGDPYDPPLVPPLEESAHEPGWTIERKERENATRAKQKVYELARSNIDSWQWFITLTFNPVYVDRDDYRACYARVRRLCERLTRKGCIYLFVPEHHKDGHSYHFHGLAGGDLPLEYAGEFGPNGYKRPTYHLTAFPGFTSVQPVDNPKRAATYITKYITKDLVHLVPKGCHRYIASRSLLRPTVEYLSLSPSEFTAMLNYGEYFPPDQFELGLSGARFFKKVPVYYHLNKDHMYIVED